MPRPGFKRQRSNSKSPIGRVAKKATLSPATRLEQLEKKLAHKAIGDRPADSDDSDRLVTRTNSRFRRSNAREVFASGAVAKGDKPGAYPTRAQRLRHLERDTQQVIKENYQRRSTSTTKSASPLPAKSPLNVVYNNDENSPNPANVHVHRSATESPHGRLPRSQQTPSGETSILGTLKPRKRQASILHMIDINNESTINPEDEEQFLPDDESTPLRVDKSATPPSTSGLSSSTSRKRKLDLDRPIQSLSEISSSPLVPDSHPQTREPSLPPQDSTVQPRKKKLRVSNQNNQEEDDIMAPPQSSSPEPSPDRAKEPVPIKNGEAKLSIPSTKDLQSLMPSKRRQGSRQRTKVNEFDIPADSSSDLVEDDSVFQPRKQATKARKKQTASKSRSALSATGKASTRGKSSSNPNTSTTPATPRPSTIRTPLPLTRSINAENRKLRSPLLQTTKENQTPRPKPKPSASNQPITEKREKQSGGSSRLSTKFIASNTRSTRRTRQTEALEDQENRNSTMVDPAASLLGDIPVDDDGVVQTTEHAMDGEVADGNESQDSEGERDAVKVHTPPTKGLDKIKSKLQTQWSNKWADIDNWDLEYEEVSVSTGSDSPGRR